MWVVARLSLGWIFLWAFFDKLWGLGFNTAPDKAWIVGGSPTMGFLSFATTGPFAELFKSMAGNVFIDILFMGGLLLLGVALILGIGMRLAGYGGAIMMLLMYLAVLPKEHNPFLDEHIVYAALLILLAEYKTGRIFGLGTWWSKTKLVKKYPILE